MMTWWLVGKLFFLSLFFLFFLVTSLVSFFKQLVCVCAHFYFFFGIFFIEIFLLEILSKTQIFSFPKNNIFVLPPGTHHHLFFLHNLVDQIYILKIPLYVVVQHHTIKSGVQVFVKRKFSSFSRSSTASKRLTPPFILILFVFFFFPWLSISPVFQIYRMKIFRSRFSGTNNRWLYGSSVPFHYMKHAPMVGIKQVFAQMLKEPMWKDALDYSHRVRHMLFVVCCLLFLLLLFSMMRHVQRIEREFSHFLETSPSSLPPFLFILILPLSLPPFLFLPLSSSSSSSHPLFLSHLKIGTVSWSKNNSTWFSSSSYNSSNWYCWLWCLLWLECRNASYYAWW